MKDKALVSILSPCYNVEKYLPCCLDSILKQTYGNLQIVLIDDGSRDGTWSILQDYAAKDSRIEVYHQDNQGVAATRNSLLDKVNGEYVLFVDSDDWIEPDMVEFLMSKATESTADVVSCKNVINDTPVSALYSEESYSKECVVRDFLFHTKVRGQLWNKLFKASLFEGIRFNTEISYGEDALFCWDVFQKIKTLLYTNKELYHYRMVNESLSHSSFGPKKLSAHYVWESISMDVQKLWPKYIDIARARQCIEDTLLLRDAAHCGSREMNNVKMLQATIKKHWHCLNRVKITSLKMKIYSFLACRSYWLAGKI